MEDALRSENDSLRQQLQALLSEARKNEEKMRRFDQLEWRLIGARSLAELIRLLLAEYKSVFELDAVTLALVDPEYEVARILEENGESPCRPGELILLAAPGLLADCHGDGQEPSLSAYEPGRHATLFGPDGPALASVALLPLVCQGELIGSFNLGSRLAERFAADSGTAFLARLSAIVAVCLDSALNHERLRLAGLTDPLTSVNNRRYFEHRCLEEIGRARRHGLALSCMFLDVDKFKRINDRHGHQAGDEVLRKVARLIKHQLRGSDILARYGGEEFVILLPQTAIHQARDIAERIRRAIAAQGFQPVPGEILPVTISIGISALPEDVSDLDCTALAKKLVAAADQALYQAKESGRNRVMCEFMPAAAPAGWEWLCRNAVQWMWRGAH